MENTHNLDESYRCKACVASETNICEECLRLEWDKMDRKNAEMDLMDPGWRTRKPKGPICTRMDN